MDLASVGAAAVASPPTPKVEDSKPPVTEVKDAKEAESSTESLPWHKDQRWQDFQKEKKTLEAANAKLQKILKDNELEDADDLEDLVKSGKHIKGKVTDPDKIDEIIAKAQERDSWVAYWDEQKKRQQKDTEDPSERAERLEQQLELERRKRAWEVSQKKQTEDTKRAINQYEREVSSLISEVGISKPQEAFILELFGVNNPSNDVDITDRKAIKKLVADGVKKYEAFKQSIIADYLAEKKGIVNTGTGTASVSTETTKKIGLKDAHKMAAEQIKNIFRATG